MALPFDVAELAAHEAALDQLEAELGPLTTLVNNAGVGVMERGDPLNASEASWDRCLKVNAKALFFLTQAVAKRLIGREGLRVIVSITSSNASAVAVPRSEYCASKAAAAMATAAWAARLGPEGVQVYDVRPGLIATDMTAPVIAQYEQRAKDGLTLIPRVGQPEEVGEIVATLATGGLPDTTGALDYILTGTPLTATPLGPDPVRVCFSAAHVVADPFADDIHAIDWEATMAFRRHLDGLSLGIAEAMDTAQRGMGLGWPQALELVRRTRAELPDALVFNGCGTDHLGPAEARGLDDVRRAYLEQVAAIQAADARIILMASRALAKLAQGPDDYVRIYSEVLAACDKPVILHWLGEMFDPALAGYWGTEGFAPALDTVAGIIEANAAKVDGIKISLLDAEKEIALRNRLPEGVKMYTGDDFNYPKLIQGDVERFSRALLGIFDPLAVAVGRAVGQLGEGDVAGFRATLDPIVPLARHIFRAPTQFYKTGVV
ncbi:Enoyl-(Acyl carrier protein) reductase [Jannaschia seohaensis]|uniref:Enoyl-(Acyl carrier protein) reductase n=1 Tax=Jannaschia seohaensis TaxID=475081 RepID=A0A2Y9BXR5_9RHOB|nr:enoyl-ACP reductase-like protein [Jannaschia seohaensis]SSA41292.1 Enoyl-(Acyl carrier protein) reductase [Jannaschia seohaensis]